MIQWNLEDTIYLRWFFISIHKVSVLAALKQIILIVYSISQKSEIGLSIRYNNNFVEKQKTDW